MKHILFLLLLTAGTIMNTSIMAQQSKKLTKEQVAAEVQKTTDSLKLKLNLSNDQAVRFFNTERKFLNDRLDISPQISSLERKQLLQNLEQKRNDDLKKIFTPQQYLGYQAIVEGRRVKSEQRRRQQNAGNNATQ